MIIGITGGTGCGKTTALEVIRQMGGVVLDCDAIYHELLRTDKGLLEAIEARFPGTVTAGQLDRKKLGALVFADSAALADLNRITHGAVRQRVLELLTPTPKLAAIDAIGLFESGLNELCQLTVAVTAPEQARITRLMAREGISREYAKARIQAQHSQEWFTERCDCTLDNSTTAADFSHKCFTFFKSLGIMEQDS